MLVVCGRCDTEYEFDDALLSERGTTVKCTNCGYQFRVRPPRGMHGTHERWVVRKANGGSERVFGSLRDLRKAIDERAVHVSDQLSRDGGPFRPIAAVAELAALFERPAPPQAVGHGQTLMGVGTQSGSQPALAAARAAAGAPPAPAPPGARQPAVLSPPGAPAPGLGRPSRRPGVSPPVVTGPSAGASASWPPAVTRSEGSDRPTLDMPPQPVGGVSPAPLGKTLTSPVPGQGEALRPTPVMPRPDALLTDPTLTGKAVPALAAPRVPGASLVPGAAAVPPGAAAVPPGPPGPGSSAASFAATRPAAAPAPAGVSPPAGSPGPRAVGVPVAGFGQTLPSNTSGARPLAVPSPPPIAVAPAGQRLTPGGPSMGGSSFPPTRRSEASDRPTPNGVDGASFESFASEDRRSASYKTLPPEPEPAAVPAPPAPATSRPSRFVAANAPPVTERVTASQPPATARIAPGATGNPSGTPHSPTADAGRPDLVALASSPTLPQEAFGLDTSASDTASNPAVITGGLRGAGRAPRQVLFASVPPSQFPTEAGAVGFSPAPPSYRPPPAAGSDKRAGGLRWVVGLVLLGGGILLASTLGKDYLSRFARPKDVTSPVQGPAQAHLAEAATQLRDGQLEQAEAALIRARSEGAPPLEAAFAQARISLARADLQWLRLRLMSQPAGAPSAGASSSGIPIVGDPAPVDRVSAERVFAERVRDVQSALGALDSAPPSPRRALIEIELLGLQGRVAAARQQVERAMLDTGQPEVLFALAKLDLGEAEPAWPSVVSRLVTASEAEGGLGRARSALIYALARAGELEKARAEHERLATLNSAHPLLGELKRWLDAASAASLATDGSQQPAPDAELPGAAEASAGNGSARNGAGKDHQPALGSDARQLLEQAAAARASGDLAGARAKYEQALAASPGNLAVLSGLGGVARLEGKYQEAKGYYDQVLERNPDYVAALVGAADVRWLMGNRDGAVALYGRIPEGSPFHAHAQRRIADQRGANKGSADGTADSDRTSGPSSPKDPGDEGPAASEKSTPREPTDVPEEQTPSGGSGDAPEKAQDNTGSGSETSERE